MNVHAQLRVIAARRFHSPFILRTHVVQRRLIASHAATSSVQTGSLEEVPILNSLGIQSHAGFDIAKALRTLPQSEKGAHVRALQTFDLPDEVSGTESDRALARHLIAAWQADGILQISMPPKLQVLQDAVKASKRYFAQTIEEKQRCVDRDSFAGHIKIGEEITAGTRDQSEIFTVTKDLPRHDPRVNAKWPCHGPTPWSSLEFRNAITKLMEHKGEVGEKLLHLIGLGLGLKDPRALTRLTKDGWHHMRVLKFPRVSQDIGNGPPKKGINSHTDYGLLVIAAQDEVGGLFVRPPYAAEETLSNWKSTAAGCHAGNDGWLYVAPQEGVFTVFPGDALQLLTANVLKSTPHKVALNTTERFAFAYFHEPNFNAICKPFPELASPDTDLNESFHYGRHFTNMFMRNYPDRLTARCMREEHKMDILPQLEKEYGFTVVD